MMTISNKIKRVACAAMAAALLVTGVVVPKNLQDVNAASAIDISKVTLNGGSVNLDPFAEYDIAGEITSERSFTKVTCTITDSLGKTNLQTAEWPNGNTEKNAQKKGVKKLELKDTKINKKLISFKYLNAGKYILNVKAENKKGVVAEKKIPFGIKYNEASFVLAAHKRAFPGEEISDSVMAVQKAVVYVEGAKEFYKDLCVSQKFVEKYGSDRNYIDAISYTVLGKLLDEAMFQNLLSKLQKGTDRRTIVEMLFRYEEFTKDCNRYGVRPNR